MEAFEYNQRFALRADRLAGCLGVALFQMSGSHSRAAIQIADGARRRSGKRTKCFHQCRTAWTPWENLD